MRRLVPLSLLFLLSACPSYDRYGYVTDQKGLMAPDDYAKYGADQAIAVAVGREFAKAHAGNTPEAYATQAGAALTYAKRFPQLKSVTADTLGHRLVQTLRDFLLKGYAGGTAQMPARK